MTETVEAPAAAQTEIKPIHHWIGGKTYEGQSGRTGAVYNPARGVQSGAVDLASADEVDKAVQAAKEASSTWRTLSLCTPSAGL